MKAAGFGGTDDGRQVMHKHEVPHRLSNERSRVRQSVPSFGPPLLRVCC